MSDPDFQQGLVSVVMPAYNHERYVQQALQSILEQTYRDLELIITNDGSTDRTHEKIEEMLPQCRTRFRRVEYVNRAHQGCVYSFNECLSLAKGDYVYIIASDDLAHENAITHLHEFLDAHPDHGLAVGDNAIIDDVGRVCHWGHRQAIVYDPSEAHALTFADFLRKSRPEIDFDGPEFGSYENLLVGNHVPNGYLVRKSIIDLFGGYSEEAPQEDWHLMLQISKHAKLKLIDEILFYYRWHATNTIKQRDMMNDYSRRTLLAEAPYAIARGYGKYIPKSRTIRFLGVKLLTYRRTHQKTVLRMLGLTLYKRRH